jgi:hypothetical protein
MAGPRGLLASLARRGASSLIGDHVGEGDKLVRVGGDRQFRDGRAFKRNEAGHALEDRNRQQLYEIAKKQNIPGRSKMGKWDLIKAIRKAR